MGLEAITRQEQIIVGKDLKPVTRMEKFLKSYGGGSGGGADWNASEGEAGYVKNRTHYEKTTVVNEPLNITWVGNTEGLVSVAGLFYKVSDLVLTDEQISLVTVHGSDGSSYGATNHTDAIGDMVFVGFSVKVVVIKKDNAEQEGIIFPEKGLYFMMEGRKYVTSLTTTEPIEQTKTEVKRIDRKYLPINLVTKEQLAAKEDIGKIFFVNIDTDGISDWYAGRIAEAVAKGCVAFAKTSAGTGQFEILPYTGNMGGYANFIGYVQNGGRIERVYCQLTDNKATITRVTVS